MVAIQAFLDSLGNIILLVVIPFSIYVGYHLVGIWRRSKHVEQRPDAAVDSVELPPVEEKVPDREPPPNNLLDIARRAGLAIGQPRYLGYAAILAVVSVGHALLFPPPVDASTRDGSAFQSFDGLGLTTTSVIMALFYAFVKTGFCEEFLFRGLIAGSLSRRMTFWWANIIQSLIFLLPHLLILVFAPEMWTLLPLVFLVGLILGWLRIKSGSILGPWLVHGCGNFVTALGIAVRSAS